MAAPAATAAASAPLDTVLAYLQAQVGKPYKFYTAGPDSFDCSGLVRAAYLQVGIKLPHYSLLQSKQGVAVDWTAEAIRPGDLVFTISSSSPNEIGHVGIAIDSRRWIQAAGTGDAVRIGPMPKPTSIRAVRRVL
jgi:cell wall-associated NlpC family hydrolase